MTSERESTPDRAADQPATADLIAALRRPEAYPAPPDGPVAVVHTHISVLFFTEKRVYKVKKPIRLDFLDYSTLERRRHFCAEEVRLNRRLAPGVYLGVVPITRADDGAIRVSGPGETIEHAVEMVRLPESRMMSAVLERGEIDNGRIDDIARLLTDFHREAAGGPDVAAFAQPAEVAAQVHENLRGLEAFVGDDASPPGVALSHTLHDHLSAAARRWLDDHPDTLEQRVREGRIREGHGDLHAGNICLREDAIVIYDCIEFARRFRCRDVACELAFLAMDLDLRCFRGFASYLLHRYAELTDDPDLPAVAAFYKLHLALVRGRVASLRAADPGLDADERATAQAEALGYLHLAGAYTLPRALILMCGLPGTGKSHAARAIGRPFEAAVLRSDVARKERAGLDPRSPGGGGRGGEIDSGIYTPQFTRRTYAALLERAREHLRRGTTVIVDATFPAASMRRPFVGAARDLGVACLLVEVTCPETIVRARLEQRRHDTGEVSDADWDVYRQAKVRFEPPEELPASQRVRVDGQLPPAALVGAVIDRLIAPGSLRRRSCDADS